MSHGRLASARPRTPFARYKRLLRDLGWTVTHATISAVYARKAGARLRIVDAMESGDDVQWAPPMYKGALADVFTVLVDGSTTLDDDVTFLRESAYDPISESRVTAAIREADEVLTRSAARARRQQRGRK